VAFIAPVPVDLDEVRRHAERNGLDYLGPLTQPSLPEDPHRTRCQRCGKISAERVGDIGWGCTCRSNPKRQTEAKPPGAKAQNLLRDSDHNAIGWWDHDSNPESLWQTAKLRSPKSASWRCPTCSTTFTAVIRDMTSRLSSLSCPACKAEWERAYEREKRELSTKSVADIPQLAALWIDPTPPALVPVMSSDYFKFRCANGHQSTRRPWAYMRGGCSYCLGGETRKANAEAAVINPNSARLSPEIRSQWHPTRNGNWLLAQVSPDSRRIAWWKDPVCGHEWQATPRERDKYQRLRCPECETVLDSLAFLYPELAAQWAPENSVSPWHVRPSASTWAVQPTWICPNNSGHRWSASPASRVTGSTCPDCQESGKSIVELAHMTEARRLFGNAASGHRIYSESFGRRGAWTVDILVELGVGRQLAIEYDGAYWHRDKVALDVEKSRDLLLAGLTVVRLREAPLASLAVSDPKYYEITVFSDAPDPAGVIARVRSLVHP
jgi:Probable Zinc-ribbon domain